MPYTQITNYEQYADQLGQVYINASVSDVEWIAGSVNDFSDLLRRVVARYVGTLLAGDSAVRVDADDVHTIMETWADNDYPPFAEAVRIWARHYGSLDLPTRILIKMG